jgi:ADP-ribose pyrophosphatase YjhB (NUDIX family)
MQKINKKEKKLNITAIHCCLINEANEYLCSKRMDGKGCEIGFGGGLNKEEDPMSGLLRELAEESGLAKSYIRKMKIAATKVLKLPRETAPNILVWVLIVSDRDIMDHFANFRPEMSGGEVSMIRWRKIGDWKIFEGEGTVKNEDRVRKIQVDYFGPLITTFSSSRS